MRKRRSKNRGMYKGRQARKRGRSGRRKRLRSYGVSRGGVRL